MRPAPQFEAGALWLARLDPGHDFDSADRRMVLNVFSTIDAFAARSTIWKEGELQFDPFILVEGMAGSVRSTVTGRRQMISILVPGDLCDGEEPMEPPAGRSVIALSDCRLAFLSHPALEELFLFSPRVRAALRRLELEQKRTVQEWILNLGRRSAATRLANLFCELYERLSRVGLVRKSAYELPLTQQDLADVSGLSVIHVNRVLQQFRREGLLRFAGGLLQILDLPALRELGEFLPGTYFDPSPVAHDSTTHPPP
jgi:CRP-like cAMP-binding protein